jgi:hypothetical protein
MTEYQIHTFAEIYRRLGATPDPEGLLLALGAEYIKSFSSTTVGDFLGYTLETVRVGNSVHVHSIRGPAYCNRYYLFGHPVTQETWFRVLGVGEEEQIIHRLRYGSH